MKMETKNKSINLDVFKVCDLLCDRIMFEIDNSSNWQEVTDNISEYTAEGNAIIEALLHFTPSPELVNLVDSLYGICRMIYTNAFKYIHGEWNRISTQNQEDIDFFFLSDYYRYLETIPQFLANIARLKISKYPNAAPILMKLEQMINWANKLEAMVETSEPQDFFTHFAKYNELSE